jgi:hypothetical protein
MMLRTLHVAILRNAALFVPAPERAEWFAEWRAELYYVEHGATSFCLGSFRDALWLRRNSPNPRPAFRLESPFRCVLFLVGLAILILALALPSWKVWLPAGSSPGSPPGREQFAFGLLGMYLLSLLVLLTLNPLGLGECRANRYAPAFLIRLRRWVFLALKIALLVPTVFFAISVVISIFPPASPILFLGWIFGLRWALADQRQRCPVCLHLLSNPVEIGSPAQTVLGWYGTELICTRGHGLLYVPGTPTSWCSRQRWQYLDPTWSSLRP